MNTVKKLSTFAFLTLASLPAFAHWSLQQEQSSLHFVSVKNDTIAETNTFKSYAAEIDDNGKVSVTIDLGSVDTNIALRDERLRTLLFQTDNFPKAKLSAQLPENFIQTLKTGHPTELDLPLELSLHGQTQTLTASLAVTRLDEHQLLVATRSPILVDAKQFSLAEGLAQLQKLAGLNSIAPLVPVTGVWVFNDEH